MGIIDPSSPLFGASGKIGNVVLYTVGGKTYFRSVPVRKKYEASEAVQAQHGRLAGAQTMYKSVKRGMLKEVFHAEARRLGVRSGYNLQYAGVRGGGVCGLFVAGVECGGIAVAV